LDRGALLVSEATVTELREVLARKKFDRYVSLEDRDRFLAMLVSDATLVQIMEEVRACRDPKDDECLALAVNGGAACIVTGDQDLLILHPFREVSVLTPQQFLAAAQPGTTPEGQQGET
jgi:putative PIN family toxin of toxin-antitoxin system